jgi:hypothetical protein
VSARAVTRQFSRDAKVAWSGLSVCIEIERKKRSQALAYFDLQASSVSITCRISTSFKKRIAIKLQQR